MEVELDRGAPASGGGRKRSGNLHAGPIKKRRLQWDAGEGRARDGIWRAQEAGRGSEAGRLRSGGAFERTPTEVVAEESKGEPTERGGQTQVVRGRSWTEGGGEGNASRAWIIEQGRGHHIVRTGAVTWCRRCGGHAEKRIGAVLAGECKPIQVGEKSGRAYRRSLLLRRRHPITREKLADGRGGEVEVKLAKEESKEEGGGSHSRRKGEEARRREEESWRKEESKAKEDSERTSKVAARSRKKE